MKRYRVWQANREVFLWPEDWLDPELRDDQSPLFQQTMSDLLQGDITDDAAAAAYLDYLTGLEEVAKLEPMWSHARPGLEDLPLTPVVWNGRLFLFWLKIIKQGASSTGNLSSNLSDPEATISDTKMSDLQQAADSHAQDQNLVEISAVLNWTEYYNGKWQPTKTSDLAHPTSLGRYPATGEESFDAQRNLVQITPAQLIPLAPFAMPTDALIPCNRTPAATLMLPSAPRIGSRPTAHRDRATATA